MGEQSEIEGLLRLGIAAVKAGRDDEAHDLLSRVLELDPENETGWLWMSAVVADDDKMVCLQNVLAINPSNEMAQLGLQSLLGKAVEVEDEEEEIEAAEPEEPPGETGEEADPNIAINIRLWKFHNLHRWWFQTINGAVHDVPTTRHIVLVETLD